MDKFKVWDNDEKRFLSKPVLIDQDGDVFGLAYSSQIVYYDGDLKIVHSTGLLDKNGVEIYEGDVVKGTAIQIEGGFDYFGEVEFITQNTAYGLQVTEPMRNGMAGGWSIDQLRTRISLDHITGEVIGNIYENPELLKE